MNDHIYSWIDFNINPTEKYVLVTVFGEPSLDQYLKVVSDLEDHPDYDRSLDRICDFTRAESARLPTIELLRFTNRLRKLPITYSTRTALVCERGVAWGFLSMLANHLYRGEYKLCQSLDAAATWLGLDNL